MTQPTPEQMERARKAAAAVHPYSHNSALILDGERDGTDIVQAALAAILQSDQQQAELLKHADAMAGALGAIISEWVEYSDVEADDYSDGYDDGLHCAVKIARPVAEAYHQYQEGGRSDG